MRMKKGTLSDDDKKLWEDTMRLHAVSKSKKQARHAVRRRAHSKEEGPPLPVRVSLRQPPPKPSAPLASHHRHDPSPTPHALSAPDKGMLARVKDGRRSIDARLDLHHLTVARAHAALVSFIAEAHAEGCRTLLVITGKGKNGQGHLRQNMARWLEADGTVCRLISSVAQAAPRHGGGGAFYVFLTKH